MPAVLDELDDVAWDRLGHAYGAATDVPGILREVAAGDADALSELFGNIWHQGTVYEATAYAVPFLVELLDVPGTDVTGLLGLLSVIADGYSYADVHESPSADADSELGRRVEKELGWVRAARDAVAAGAPVYLRLLADGSEDVRAWAANVIGVAASDGEVATEMLARAEGEDSAFVRASVILAAGALRVADDGRVRLWLDDPEPAPRLAAALVAARVGGEPDERVTAVLEHDAPLSLDTLGRLPWSVLGADSLVWVIECLGDRWDLQVRLVTTWMRHDDAGVRKAAVFAAEHPLHAWRPAAEILVPALARRLEDPERGVRYWAASHIAGAGRAAALAVEELWATVRREGVQHNTPAASALEALCRLGDPRAAEYLAGRLADDPTELEGLKASIDLIGPWAGVCREPLLRAVKRVPKGNERIAVINAIGRLYAGADDAEVHEVVRMLRTQCRSHPHISTRVLGDLGPAAAPAQPELRAALRHKEPVVRINAARALWRISGATEKTLPVLREAINEGRYVRTHALEALAEMGTAGIELAPLLPELFEADDDWTALRAATAYWYVTGDSAPVLPVLLGRLRAGRYGVEAARCLGDIGPAASAAVPALREGAGSGLRQQESGSAASWVADDETWAATCAEALTRIESAP